jgi:hypothetical protein
MNIDTSIIIIMHYPSKEKRLTRSSPTLNINDAINCYSLLYQNYNFFAIHIHKKV